MKTDPDPMSTPERRSRRLRILFLVVLVAFGAFMALSLIPRLFGAGS